MYIYQLTYEDEGSLLMIGYFGSWKKARSGEYPKVCVNLQTDVR